MERFDIDNEVMNNDQMTSERKVAEMKKVSTTNKAKKAHYFDFFSKSDFLCTTIFDRVR